VGEFKAFNNSDGWLTRVERFYLQFSFVCELINQNLIGDVFARRNPVFMIHSTYDLLSLTCDQWMYSFINAAEVWERNVRWRNTELLMRPIITDARR